MRRKFNAIMLAALAAGSTFLAAPQRLAAQSSSSQAGTGKWERSRDGREVTSQREREAQARAAREQAVRDRDRYDRDDDSDDDRYKGKDKDKYKHKNKDRDDRGPSFCRSGAGHPVQGRSWCVQKGFGLGDDRWGRAGWGNVSMGRSTRSGTVGGGSLSDILGRVVYGRLQSQSSRLGGGPLTGRWVSANGGPLLLQVHSGRRPIAEFVDANRDGRAEVVLLNFGR